MNKAAMMEIKEQFNKQLSGMKYVDIYLMDNKPEPSSYWSPGKNDFSDVVDAEREHSLNR